MDLAFEQGWKIRVELAFIETSVGISHYDQYIIIVYHIENENNTPVH